MQHHVAYLHYDCPPIVLHQLALPIHDEAESFLAAVEEVLSVPVDVEPDQVAPEHPHKDLVVPGDQPEHVPRRERDVEEEGDLEPSQSLLVRHLSEASRCEHEVVVMDPDKDGLGGVVGGHSLGRGFGELSVDEGIGLPVFPFKNGSVGHRVEGRPQRGVTAPVVVMVAHVRVDIHRPDLAAFQSLSGIRGFGIAFRDCLVVAQM